jgi:hypothetical protein
MLDTIRRVEHRCAHCLRLNRVPDGTRVFRCGSCGTVTTLGGPEPQGPVTQPRVEKPEAAHPAPGVQGELVGTDRFLEPSETIRVAVHGMTWWFPAKQGLGFAAAGVLGLIHPRLVALSHRSLYIFKCREHRRQFVLTKLILARPVTSAHVSISAGSAIGQRSVTYLYIDQEPAIVLPADMSEPGQRLVNLVGAPLPEPSPIASRRAAIQVRGGGLLAFIGASLIVASPFLAWIRGPFGFLDAAQLSQDNAGYIVVYGGIAAVAALILSLRRPVRGETGSLCVLVRGLVLIGGLIAVVFTALRLVSELSDKSRTTIGEGPFVTVAGVCLVLVSTILAVQADPRLPLARPKTGRSKK